MTPKKADEIHLLIADWLQECDLRLIFSNLETGKLDVLYDKIEKKLIEKDKKLRQIQKWNVELEIERDMLKKEVLEHRQHLGEKDKQIARDKKMIDTLFNSHPQPSRALKAMMKGAGIKIKTNGD